MTRNYREIGFTLVEISIVMIIVGLLIGGTFGGMKLIENMQVNKTVQDLKAIESAALTFKDTFGRLPGDLTSPSTRLPSCTAAPCSTAGNGNRVIGTTSNWIAPITDTSENFVFWHHLQAANMLSMNYSNTLSMEFGEGQPSSPNGYGYRISDTNSASADGCRTWRGGTIFVQDVTSANVDTTRVPCQYVGAVDRKFDDGSPNAGRVVSATGGGYTGCNVDSTCSSPYPVNGGGGFISYDPLGF